jgi:uncharacterized protein
VDVAADDLVRSAYDAFAKGDLDAVLAGMDPDIVWEQAQGLPHGGVYHGVEAVRAAVFEPLDRDWWAEFSAEPHELVADGDTVVVLGRYRGTAKATGRLLDVPFVHVWTIEAGRAVRFRQFLDTAGWIEALAPA